jgi:outer membrane protein OmpA-like peptidoglycan-associated protein
MPLSSAPPRPLDESEKREYERWHKTLWPDHAHLSKGIMEWRLEPNKTFSQFDTDGWTKRQIQVKFTPNRSLGTKTITFLQTVLQTTRNKSSSKKPKLDVLSEEFDPFYGMNWDIKTKKWVPEGALKGYKSAPSSATDRSAYLYDEPYAPPGQVKMFETVAVVPETGETLGALRWSVGKDAERVEFTDAPSAEFGAAVERFYGTPTAVGPESGREQRYDVILDGFTANDATLTADQERQLGPIVARVKQDSKLKVEVGGFADATEIDPSGTSEQRAQAVASYLIGNGVPKVNLRVAGFGASWARYPPSAREGRNRRVQIRLQY